MRHRNTLLIWLMSLLLWTHAFSAFADKEEDAKKAMEKGSELFGKKKYKDALGAYLQALELVPERTGPYREVARCYQQLENAPEALHYFTEYLRRKPDAPEKQEFERAIAELQGKLPGKGTVPLTVTSNPAGAAVYLVNEAGEAHGIGFTPLQGVAVPGTTVAIRLLSAQYPAKDTPVDLTKSPASLEISLLPVEPDDTLDDLPPKTAPVKPEAEKKKRGLLYASLGAGAASLSAGAIFFVEKNTFEGLPADNLDALQDVRTRLFIEAGAADALGATAIVLGALWVVQRSKSPKESSLLLSPAGVKLIGSF